MIEKKLIRIPVDDLDSDRRCQGVGKHGQCPYYANANSQYCDRHANNKLEQKANREAVRNFRLNQWQSRVNDFADSPKVKSLREEVGIVRMLLESYITRCQTENDLILFSNKISDLVIKSEKLISSCHKLEEASGLLMDKETAIEFSNQIVDIIGKHVVDAAVLEEISKEILLAIGSLNKLTNLTVEEREEE